jgi:hypothetical protein
VSSSELKKARYSLRRYAQDSGLINGALRGLVERSDSLDAQRADIDRIFAKAPRSRQVPSTGAFLVRYSTTS